MQINGVDININLLNKRTFLSFGNYRLQQNAFQYLSCFSFYRSIRIGAPLPLPRANVLGLKRKAHNPVTIFRLKILLPVPGAQQVSIDNAFLGPIPKRFL